MSCDACGHWVHQICALYCDSFVDTTTSTGHSSGNSGGGGYMCPLCRVEYVAAASVACEKQARKQHNTTTTQTNNTNNNTIHTTNTNTSSNKRNNNNDNNNDTTNNDNSSSSISKVQTRRNKRQKLTTEVKSESTINSNKPTTLLDNNTTNTASTTTSTTNTNTIQCTVSSSSSRSSSEMKVEDGDNEDVCVTATVGDPLTAPAPDFTAGATTTVVTSAVPVGGGCGLNDEVNSLACSTDEETVGPVDDHHHPREATPTTTTTTNTYPTSTDIAMTSATVTTTTTTAVKVVAGEGQSIRMMVEESTQTSDHDSVASYGLATYGTGQVPVAESTQPTYATTESKLNEQESSTSSHTPQLHTNNTTTTSTNTNTSTSTAPPSTTSSSTTSTPPNHSLNQWSARALPRTKLSDFLEALITERLIEAGYTHITTTLTIRMTSNCPMRLEVPEQILTNMMNNDNSYLQRYLAYKQKCILLFQMIDGVDVCLFCLYIQEFDRYTPAPNNKVQYNIYYSIHILYYICYCIHILCILYKYYIYVVCSYYYTLIVLILTTLYLHNTIYYYTMYTDGICSVICAYFIYLL